MHGRPCTPRPVPAHRALPQRLRRGPQVGQRQRAHPLPREGTDEQQRAEPDEGRRPGDRGQRGEVVKEDLRHGETEEGERGAAQGRPVADEPEHERRHSGEGPEAAQERLALLADVELPTSKQAFFVATLEQKAGELEEVTRTDPDASPGEQLAQSPDAYLRWVEANAAGYEKLTRSVRAVPEVRELVEAVRDYR